MKHKHDDYVTKKSVRNFMRGMTVILIVIGSYILTYRIMLISKINDIFNAYLIGALTPLIVFCAISMYMLTWEK